MAYADGDSLKVRIRIAFGAVIAADPTTWAWTDVTAWWHVPDPVNIGWGRSDGAEQPEPSTLALTLKNADGRFTAYNPTSPYWPHVVEWAPIQYDVDLGDGAGWRNRFSGFVRRWPVTWPGRSRHQALARIEAVGIRGRLGRGKPPARSPMRRAIAASGPVGYWPGEDGVGAQVVGSALPGHAPAAITGDPAFSSLDFLIPSGLIVRPGTPSLVDLAGGLTLTADLPATATEATASAWTVGALDSVDATATTPSTYVLLDVETPGGTYTRWQVRRAVADTYLVAITSSGAETIVITANGMSGLRFRDIAVYQDGANITAGLDFDLDGVPGWSGSVAGTLTGITRITVNPDAATSSQVVLFGHLAVWAASAPPAIIDGYIDQYGVFVDDALHSFKGEGATDRLVRLCAEDGVPLQVTAAVTAEDAITSRMSWQSTAAQLALYQECEAADQGLLYEQGFGLAFLPRSGRYNPPVALTIDAAAGQLGAGFSPISDDQRLRNRWTVTELDGASAVVEDQASIAAQGEIEATVRVNLDQWARLPDHAAWRLRTTTVREPRYSSLSVDLGAHPELAAAWCDCRSGSRVQVVNGPPQSPGLVDQIITKGSETFRGRRSWKVTMSVVPALPWQVAEVDGEQLVASSGSTLAAGADTTDTALLVTSTANDGPWTEDVADMPLDVVVSGEPMLATSTGPGLLDSFDREVTNGWGGGWVNEGGVPADHMVTGGQAIHRLTSAASSRRSVIGPDLLDSDQMVTVTIPMVAVTDSIDVALVSRYVDGGTYYLAVLHCHNTGLCEVRIRKQVAGTYTTLHISNGTMEYEAGSRFTIRMQTFGSLLRARAWPVEAAQPIVWHCTVVDTDITAPGPGGVRSNLQELWGGPLPVDIAYDDYTLLNPQTFTVERGIAGFTKLHAADAPVDVRFPAIAAL